MNGDSRRGPAARRKEKRRERHHIRHDDPEPSLTQAVVQTAYGALAGNRDENGRYCFKGVPYARAPLGPLRWQPPQRLAVWEGVRPARRFGPVAPQPRMPENSLVYGHEREMSEDCLFLNIWTAGLDAAERRPVIFWIHLGGFMMGCGHAPIYDGSALAAAGAVVVSLNYRLGRLGFLAHPALARQRSGDEDGLSGNYGLLDQIAALHWVRENISAFGGDPGCVTVYGVSAGGYSVSVLMTSPLARGLFHRAIGASGGMFGPVSDTCESGDFLQTRDAAEKFGAQVMAVTGAATAEALRALSVQAVLDAKLPDFAHARRGLLDTTYPILDGQVLPLSPYEVFAGRSHSDVPLMTGSNAHERSITPFNLDRESFDTDTSTVMGPLFERFQMLYPHGPDDSALWSSRLANADRLFSWQNWSWARLQAEHGVAPAYYYNFDHEPPVPQNSVAEQAMGPVGAFHSAELPYVFRNLHAREWTWSEQDRALSTTMSQYWLNFAANGDPNGNGLPVWQAFTCSGQKMMRFDGTATPTTAPCNPRFAFLDEFYRGWRDRAMPGV